MMMMMLEIMMLMIMMMTMEMLEILEMMMIVETIHLMIMNCGGVNVKHANIYNCCYFNIEDGEKTSGSMKHG